MARCFVIQPFDKGGPYDKRYHGVMVPAIKAAGLEPYRVDEDPGSTILIDDIEKGIRDAEVCLADITTNNPNIWYEVGFALANGKAVVLICQENRPDPFPFDIRHRHIISYQLHSPSDFETLKNEVTARLITIMPERSSPDSAVQPHEIKNSMRSAGYTNVAIGLALESLNRKAMIEYFEDSDWNGNQFTSCRLTPKGVDWMLANQERFKMRRDEGVRQPEKIASGPITDEDIPF
jgi:hypothetical protein